MLRKNKSKSALRLDFTYKFLTQRINFTQFRKQQGLKTNFFVHTTYLIYISEMRLSNFDSSKFVDLKFTTSGVTLRDGRLSIKCSDGSRDPVYYVDGSARRGKAGCGIYAGETECYSFRCEGPVRYSLVFIIF